VDLDLVEDSVARDCATTLVPPAMEMSPSPAAARACARALSTPVGDKREAGAALIDQSLAGFVGDDEDWHVEGRLVAPRPLARCEQLESGDDMPCVAFLAWSLPLTGWPAREVYRPAAQRPDHRRRGCQNRRASAIAMGQR